jgi:tetratricopeptide (TPR) repeat protein
LRRLGVLHCNMGKQEEAEALFREAIEIHESFENSRSFYACLGLLAEILLIMERHDEAERLVHESMRASLRLRDQVATALTRAVLGRIHLDRGNARGALVHMQAGLDGQAAAGWTVAVAISRIDVALAHLELAALDDAHLDLSAASEVLTNETQDQARLQCLSVLALVRHRLGDAQGALVALISARELSAGQAEVERALVALVAGEIDPGSAELPSRDQLEQLGKRSLQLRSLLRVLA